MTAVLSATDPLNRERLSALDDSQINYSSSPVDWRAKYNEVADMLTETRAELDDFHHASKELEAELEAELQRTEKSQHDLKIKVAKTELERDEWKTKFMSLQTTHNTTTASLQQELDKLRQDYQRIKVQLRELEMGNDDLERTERAISSSLADVEAKYSKTLEEKILLEHELMDKANLEEQCQRLKDELRDATTEITVLKDQLEIRSSSKNTPQTSSLADLTLRSSENLLNTPPPPDLSLSELGPSSDSLSSDAASEKVVDQDATPRKRELPRHASVLSPRLNHQPYRSTPPNISTGIPRSSTTPSLYGSPVPRPLVNRNTSSTSSTSSTTSRSKGVQMVSEMRARVKNLEQKIHTKVPRLRMGSINTGRPSGNFVDNAASTSSKGLIGRPSWESSSRRSDDKPSKDNGGDSSGWVLIMESSPSPRRVRTRDSDRNSDDRSASPLGYRSAASTSSTATTLGPAKVPTLFQSTATNASARRPQSRLSAGSSTTSSIPTPTSRPATPTFLPIPTSTSLNFKRSTGPPSKRSSLGTANPVKVSDFTERLNRGSLDASTITGAKPLPGLPNVTVRNKLPTSATSNALLSKSRIGRPSGGLPRRKSMEDEDAAALSNTRPRSGSTHGG